MAKLLLDVALIDLGRAGETGAQGVAGEEDEAVFLGQIGSNVGVQDRALDQARDMLVVYPPDDQACRIRAQRRGVSEPRRSGNLSRCPHRMKTRLASLSSAFRCVLPVVLVPLLDSNLLIQLYSCFCFISGL